MQANDGVKIPAYAQHTQKRTKAIGKRVRVQCKAQ